MVSMFDNILTPALIATASALVVHYVITRRSESARYPPGPLCFPLLGSLPIIIWFGGKLSKLFEYCHRKYGDVSIVNYFCLLYTIVFCSTDSRMVYSAQGLGFTIVRLAGLAPTIMRQDWWVCKCSVLSVLVALLGIMPTQVHIIII